MDIPLATNTDESLVRTYSLPDILTGTDNKKITSVREWEQIRRPELLELFKKEMYGYLPPLPAKTEYKVLSIKNDALDNTAIRKEIKITFYAANGKSHSFVMLLYIPKNISRPAPVFVGLNFKGNHNCTDEVDVLKTGTLYNGRLAVEERSIQTYRWRLKETIKRGFASATVCYHDIYPDDKTPDAWRKSIYNLFYPHESDEYFHRHASAISAWAWGLSRMLDCLEKESMIDASQAFVHGHSRLGKSALWAGVNDTRFKLTISNNSGCCGAALSRRNFGETIEHITYHFPHWFVSQFRKYARNESQMPFDQHCLLALIAPRHLAVASAENDLHADPKGEFLSGAYAGSVYKLFGFDTYTDRTPCPINSYITGQVSYHIRSGKHEQILHDWIHYWKIAESICK